MLTLQLYGYWLFEKLYLTYERVFHLSNNVFCTLSIHLLFFFWISDKTLLLMCDISLQSIWISNETLPLVFDVTPRWLAVRWFILICGISFLNVWISNKSLLPVFEYTTPQWCDTRQNTLSRVWYSISQSLDIGWNTLFSVFGYKKRLQDNTLDLPGERKNVLYVGK